MACTRRARPSSQWRPDTFSRRPRACYEQPQTLLGHGYFPSQTAADQPEGGLAPHHHASSSFVHDLFAPVSHPIRVIAARMGTATFRALQRRARAGLGDHEQRPQIDCGVPSGIVLPAPRHPYVPRPSLELLELGECVFQAAPVADDARVPLHHPLQRGLHRERILTVALERRERLTHGVFDLGIGDRRRGAAFGGRVLPCPPAEHEQVAEGVAAEAVGAGMPPPTSPAA
jgi:hypothetical protein